MARFDRPKPSLKPQPTVLIICEDKKSGKRYLEDASIYFRVKVKVEIIHCGKTDPKGIVEEALNRGKKFDKVFCVIDRDTHETFNAALNLAKSSKVEIIASYPCFEFWLLIHFDYCRKPYMATGKLSAAEMLIKDLKKHDCFANYDKGQELNIFNLMLNNGFNKARQLSPRILTEAIESGEMNPSTQLHELMNEFEKLSKPQPIDSK